MKGEKSRKSLVIRVGITPMSRWHRSDHYLFDAYTFRSYVEEGFGGRFLWVMMSISFQRD